MIALIYNPRGYETEAGGLACDRGQPRGDSEYQVSQGYESY